MATMARKHGFNGGEFNKRRVRNKPGGGKSGKTMTTVNLASLGTEEGMIRKGNGPVYDAGK